MNAVSTLTGEQRAAIVLVSLGHDRALPLAEQLGFEAVRRIRSTLTDLSHVPEEQVLAAYADFITQLEALSAGMRGGKREAVKLLRQALGDALVDQLDGPIVHVEPPTEVWAEFAQMDPDVIADFVGKQHGAVAALMLHKLPADRVPEVLGLMPPEIAVEAIGIMSRPQDPSSAALAVAERMIEKDLLDAAVDPTSDPKIVMIGETLGTLPRELRDAALDRLQKEDEIRAAAIRSTLLRIEDLPTRLPTKSVQAVFREIGRDILIKGLAAVKANASEVSDFLLGNIAQRMADQYREDVAALPDMDSAEQDRAMGSLVREILGLSRRGTITLLAPSSDDD